MGIHNNHRQRMKARFLEHGLDNFADHNVLELLLFYTIPQGDVNPVAHALMRTFGSIYAVMDAPLEELRRVNGVGEHTALFLKLLPQICRRYLISRSSIENILKTTKSAGAFFIPYFFGARDEVVYIACLDAKAKVISCIQVGHGSVNSAGVSVRKIVEKALTYNATSVILAHNHTSGIALPSLEDRLTTKKIFMALAAVDIALVDHIVVADDDFVSMADNGTIREFQETMNSFMLY